MGKLINSVLRPLGVKLERIVEAKDEVEYKNRYDLKPDTIDGIGREARKIFNLLNYTKQNDTTYNAAQYDAGYHELQIDDHTLSGQRVPRKRLDLAPYDFNGKTVLDLGCNQGGMLHAISDEIKQGVGMDYDSKMVNAANRIKAHKGTYNLGFYVFDLENESLDLIENYLPEKVDIVFLLSVCMWITTWEDVIDKVHSISDAMLFESNGTPEEQESQYNKLTATYNKVELLQDTSPDDPRQKNRKLYFCEK